MLFFILGYFLPFYISNSPEKSKFRKNLKKHLEISSFYNSVPKIMIKCYTVPEIWCMIDVIIFHFGPFFALPPLDRKFKEISSFYTSVAKIMIICYSLPEIWCVTDTEILGWCPAGSVLPHGEKVPLWPWLVTLPVMVSQ